MFHTQGFSTAVALVKGIYVVHVRDWMSVFPRDQFLFLETEEARHRPDYTLQRLMELLETGKLLQSNYRANGAIVERERERERDQLVYLKSIK